MKKAVSPLISAVLVMIFTVTVGTMISTWMFDYTKTTVDSATNSASDEKGIIYCANSNIELSNVKISDKKFVENTYISSGTTNKFNITSISGTPTITFTGRSSSIPLVDDFFTSNNISSSTNITITGGVAKLSGGTPITKTWSSNTEWNTGTHTNTTNNSGNLTVCWGGGLYCDWNYRNKITINNTGNADNVTDYQVLINLTASNFNFSKANSDGNDTRFTWVNGSIEENISYWIESWDSIGQTARVWVKVPYVAPSGNGVVYIYYGGVNPISLSNKTETYTYYHDFKSDPGLQLWTSGIYANGGFNATFPVEGYISETLFTYSLSGNWAVVNGGDRDQIIDESMYFNTYNHAESFSFSSVIQGSVSQGVSSVGPGNTYLQRITYIPGVSSKLEMIQNNVAVSTTILDMTGKTYTPNQVHYTGRNDVGGGSVSYDATNDRITVVGRKDSSTVYYYYDQSIRKYTSKEPNAIIGSEENVTYASYLSEITATSNTISSITPTWSSNSIQNYTVEITADGSTWLESTNNTEYTSGFGSGTSLQYRINFTNKNVSIYDISLNYTGQEQTGELISKNITNNPTQVSWSGTKLENITMYISNDNTSWGTPKTNPYTIPTTWDSLYYKAVFAYDSTSPELDILTVMKGGILTQNPRASINNNANIIYTGTLTNGQTATLDIDVNNFTIGQNNITIYTDVGLVDYDIKTLKLSAIVSNIGMNNVTIKQVRAFETDGTNCILKNDTTTFAVGEEFSVSGCSMTCDDFLSIKAYTDCVGVSTEYTKLPSRC